jgi:hypothetical protein
MKRTMLNVIPLFVVTALCLPLTALAQEVVPSATVPLDFTDPGAVGKLLFDAVMNKQWGIVVALTITALIAMLRKWVPEGTVLGKWFRSKLGAIITNFAISLGGAFITLFMAGVPFSLGVVLKALSIAFTAAGGWTIFKNLTEAINEKKASNAGNAAASKPTDIINQ